MEGMASVNHLDTLNPGQCGFLGSTSQWPITLESGYCLNND